MSSNKQELFSSVVSPSLSNQLLFYPKEAEFHGFSPTEIRLASLKSELLQREADQCRADIWACKGELGLGAGATWSSFYNNFALYRCRLGPCRESQHKTSLHRRTGA